MNAGLTIKHHFNRLLKVEFVLNVATLSAGILIGQMISVATAPLITRLFLPKHFGVLAIFISITEMMTVVSSLCYETAIILPKEDEKATQLVGVSTIASVLMMTGLLVITLLFRHQIANIFQSDELAFWILFIPGLVFVRGMAGILKAWALRMKQFKYLSAANIIEPSINGLIKISVGFIFGACTGGLVGAAIVGSVSILLFMPVAVGIKNIRNLISKISLTGMKDVAIEYKKFPYFSSFNVLLNFMPHNIVIFLLGFYFTPAIVGFFYLSKRILAMPVIIIALSVNRVYFQKASQQKSNKQNILKGFRKTTIGLAAIGIIPFGILIGFGPDLFSLVFGQEWFEAGQYAQVLSPWVFLLFINAPSNAIYNIYLKQHIKLFIQIAYTLFSAIAIIAGYAITNDAMSSLAFFSASGVIILSINILVAYTFIKKEQVLYSLSSLT